MENFLPNNYELKEPPKLYMKFKPGANTFRVLTPALVGQEYWLDDKGELVPRDMQAGKGGKPIRVKSLQELIGTEAQFCAKEFWAFIVWNYETKAVNILQIKQITIMRMMESWVKNPKWGTPDKYDITVTREDGERTSYVITNDPPSEFEYKEEVKKSVASINLEALMTGDDPFKEFVAPVINTVKKQEVPNEIVEEEKVTVDDIPF